MKKINWTKWGTIASFAALLLPFLIQNSSKNETSINEGKQDVTINGTTVTNNGVNNGVMAGVLINQNITNYRHVDNNLENLLIQKITSEENKRGKQFTYIVLSASPDSEAQAYAKEIIKHLEQLHRWQVVPLPIIVFSRSGEVINGLEFNLSDQYSYKNSLEIMVGDNV